MLRKIIAYSFAGIILGVLVMLTPIILGTPFLYTTTSTLEKTGKDTAEFAAGNATRPTSLSEAAQIYGRSEAVQQITTLTILAPLMLVAASGFLAGIAVLVIARRISWLK